MDEKEQACMQEALRLYRVELSQRCQIALGVLVVVWAGLRTQCSSTIIAGIITFCAFVGLFVILWTMCKGATAVGIGNITDIAVKQSQTDESNGTTKERHEYTVDSENGRFVGTCLNSYLHGSESELEHTVGEKVGYFTYGKARTYIVKL